MEMIGFEKKCEKCEKTFEVKRCVLKDGTVRTVKKEKRFCSRICANSHSQTKEQNEVRSKSLKGNIPWIKGKVFSYEERLKYYGNRKRNGKINEISEETKYYDKKLKVFKKREFYCISCGNKLSTKTKTMKCVNCWNENTDKMRKYRHECSFKFNVYDYPEEFKLKLLEEYGWYSASNRGNNLNGISRDHMVSVRYGFDNKIDAKIIAHPANCDLAPHPVNNKKDVKCSITIDELYTRIEDWNIKYALLANRQTH